MSETTHLTYPADGVALVLIDDPPKNFGSPALWDALAGRLREAHAAGCRVAVLASDVPGYFMAHFSLQSLLDLFGPQGGAAARAPDTDAAPTSPRPPGLIEELERGPLITIAANHGQAWGGGSEISWACDLRIAGESATYGQPEVAVGLIPGAGGTTRLARLVGAGRCMELILDGRPISARDALAIGAVNRVVPDGELREAAIAWAAHIASFPADALRACKRSLLEGLDLPLAEARRNEARIFREVAGSPEARRRMAEAQQRYDAGADSQAAISFRDPGEEGPATRG